MMDMLDFETSSDLEAPQKLIGTFFGTARNYYRLSARSQEQFENLFEIDVLDEEIKALHKLIQEKDKRFDDRRFSIEVQFNGDIDLTKRKPLLAIFPETYLSNQQYIDQIEALGAEVITYPVYPLRKEYFYGSIYEKLETFYVKRGYYNV
jgi:hypothetical protein